MEFIFELFLELLGAAATSKKTPLALRIAIFTLITVLPVGVFVLIATTLAIAGNTIGSVICFIIAGLLTILFVYLILKSILVRRERKRRKAFMETDKEVINLTPDNDSEEATGTTNNSH